MSNIMVDLESMGTRSNAAIIALGAVKFSSKGLGDEFYMKVDLETCVRSGLTIDASSIMWWMQQSEAARGEFAKKGDSLFNVLKAFSRFVGSSRDAKIWGNGADFDNVVLANAYDAVNLDRPWEYWNNRCYRTVNKLLGGSIELERVGDAHNAIDDAKSQAAHLVRILAAIKGG